MPDVVILAAAVFALLLAILVLFFFRRIFRGLWHLAESAGLLFGRTPQIRIVGLGIVAWLFPRAVASPFFVVFNPIYTVVSQLPSIFSEITQIIGTSNSSSRMATAGILATDLAGVLARALLSVTTAISIPEFVMALMVWVVVGQILDAVWSDVDQQNRLVTFYRSMSPARRQNFYLVILLLFGSYLSIAAIASIPWLRETETPIETDSARLASRLTEIRLSDQEFSKRFVEPTSDVKAFREMDSFISTHFGGPQTSTQPAPDASNSSAQPVVKNVPEKEGGVDKTSSSQQKVPTDTRSSALPPPKGNGKGLNTGGKITDESLSEDQQQIGQTLSSILSRAQNDRADRIRQWHELVQRSRGEEDKLQKTVISTFQENSVGRKGSQERARYFSELDDWYRESVNAIDDQLSSCLNSINLADDLWATTSQTAMQWASGRLDSIKMAQQSGYPLLFRGITENTFFNPSASDLVSCSLPSFEQTLPQPPAPGASWGPFGLVASWLLKTESLQLALITGMLGFGLLGSAVSSFVREHNTRGPGDPLVRDLAALLIRGFSAAIVVFLAAEGGLAIFSGSGTVDPNPYILMFTCFTAAVFSEAAWARVRKRLEEGETTSKNGRDASSASDEGKSMELGRPDASTANASPPEEATGDTEQKK